jgi:excinuclease ABC subunit C
LLSFELEEEEREAISAYLSERAGRKVTVRTAERGDNKKLCDMVRDNAEEKAKAYKSAAEKDEKVLSRLAELLSLETYPERIEAYDISNLGKEHITAGMIVTDGTSFKKSDYRSFKINSVTNSTDDYASMREALSRRLDHLDDESGSFAELPDLILLDGGKGHVSVIKKLLEEENVFIPVFGMVKDEFHKTRALTDEISEISIAREQEVFIFIYKLQEEVHRYTVGRMMGAKRKTLKRSSLTEIEGIGPSKAKALLTHFKTISAVKSAEKDELMTVKGITETNALSIIKHFESSDLNFPWKNFKLLQLANAE